MGVVFFLVDVVRLAVFFGADFVVLAAFVLDFVVDLAEVFVGVAGDAWASLLTPVPLELLAPRTSLIALVCSCSVILNS